MKRVLVGSVLVAALLPGGAAHAAGQVIVASPGTTITGVYDGPKDVVVRAGPVVFVNADPLASHNVIADEKKVPSCTNNCAPLFYSGAAVGVGGVQQFSVAGVAVGDHPFHCELHSNMKGILTVVA